MGLYVVTVDCEENKEANTNGGPDMYGFDFYFDAESQNEAFQLKNSVLGILKEYNVPVLSSSVSSVDEGQKVSVWTLEEVRKAVQVGYK